MKYVDPFNDNQTYKDPYNYSSLNPLYTNFIDPHRFGAEADCREVSDAKINYDKVSSATYTFTSVDVGKLITFYTGWNLGDIERTIISVDGGVATFSPGFSFVDTSGRRCIFGTNNVIPFEKAFTAAQNIQSAQYGAGQDPVAWGVIPAGGAVIMRQGTYLFSNSLERFNAGKLGAINIPRNCSLIGQGMGSTNIAVAASHNGHVVANLGAANLRADQRMFISNFTIFGGRGLAGANCLNGIHHNTGMSNYTTVDAFTMYENIQVHQSRGKGMYMKGRGECLVQNVWLMQSESYGLHLDGFQDTRFSNVNAGGNNLTGMRLTDFASGAMCNCKSFYNGAGGGTNYADSCNWYLGDGSHSYRKGTTLLVGCEAQESRGSGWVIEGGLYKIVGSISCDPDRFGSGTRPDIKAGVHIRANGSMNMFQGFHIHAALGMDWNNEAHYGGDYAVYIERNAMVDPLNSNYENRGPRGNMGTIYTLNPMVYRYSKLGGPGITNQMNCLLSVDDEYLPSDFPGAPTGLYAFLGDDLATYLSWTAPTSNGGREIIDYAIYYKLSSSSDYLLWADGISTSTTNIPITGLTVGATYDFKVYARNINGLSVTPGTLTFNNSQVAPNAVDPVSAIIGSGQVYLSWTAPRTGGSAITDYIVKYKLSSEPTTWTTFSDGTSTNTFATVTGLVNGSSYDFQVFAVNAIGTSSGSPIISKTPVSVMATFFDTSIVGFYSSVDSTIVSSSNAITSVSDISGVGGDLTGGATVSTRPTTGLTTLNGVNVFDFDGVDDYLDLPTSFENLMNTTNMTMFFAFSLDDGPRLTTTQQAIMNSSSNTFIFYARGDSTHDWVVSMNATGAEIDTAPAAATYIAAIRRTGSVLNFYLNGNLVGTGTAASQTVTSAQIGRVNAFYGWLDGKIGAILGYTKSMSNSEINARASALATTFGGSWTNI